jgi:aspartyl-tRNA(Asn)/glutamyl-tRNA(Gln) amidotransferase subunit B
VGNAPGENAKAVSNWVMTEVLRVVSERRVPIEQFPVRPSDLAALIGLIKDGTISGKIAKDVFEEMLESGTDPRRIVESKGLLQLSDSSAIERAIDGVLGSNPAQVKKYLEGNAKLFGFFVGETMKATQGKANPKIVNDVLKRKLDALRA